MGRSHCTKQGAKASICYQRHSPGGYIQDTAWGIYVSIGQTPLALGNTATRGVQLEAIQSSQINCLSSDDDISLLPI